MQVYNALEEQADLFARQAGHAAYIFEASAQNHRKIFGLMVRLLRVVVPGPQPQALVGCVHSSMYCDTLRCSKQVGKTAWLVIVVVRLARPLISAGEP